MELYPKQSFPEAMRKSSHGEKFFVFKFLQQNVLDSLAAVVTRDETSLKEDASGGRAQQVSLSVD